MALPNNPTPAELVKAVKELEQSGVGGTTVNVNGVPQATVNFDSDPQTQLNNKLDKDTINTNTLYGKGSTANSQMMWRIDQTGNVGHAIPQRNAYGGVNVPTPTANEEATPKSYVDTALAGKQDTLTAGANITIDANNVISATGGGTATDVQVDGTSITSGGVANLATINGDYDASTNPLATENDISDVVVHDDTVTTVTEPMFADSYFTKAQVISMIYPVGSVYISLNNVNPQTYMTGTTWVAIAAGQTLWTTTTNGEGGQTVSAGIPNIKAQFGVRYATNAQNDYISQLSGNAINVASSAGNAPSTGSSGGEQQLTFDASRYNSIYSDNATTVQPPAIKVYMWQRTA